MALTIAIEIISYYTSIERSVKKGDNMIYEDLKNLTYNQFIKKKQNHQNKSNFGNYR